jgi:hypothetical protein
MPGSGATAPCLEPGLSCMGSTDVGIGPRELWIEPRHLSIESIECSRDSIGYPNDFIECPIDSIERSLDLIGYPIDSIERSLDSIDRSRDSIGYPIDSIERSLDSIEKPIDSIGSPNRRRAPTIRRSWGPVTPFCAPLAGPIEPGRPDPAFSGGVGHATGGAARFSPKTPERDPPRLSFV